MDTNDKVIISIFIMFLFIFLTFQLVNFIDEKQNLKYGTIQEVNYCKLYSELNEIQIRYDSGEKYYNLNQEWINEQKLINSCKYG